MSRKLDDLEEIFLTSPVRYSNNLSTLQSLTGACCKESNMNLELDFDLWCAAQGLGYSKGTQNLRNFGAIYPPPADTWFL
jgi:hypothetical protein